jgi:hypothetical protein
LKKALDIKAKASEKPKLKERFGGELVTYNKTMLESTRAIGSEAYKELKEANKARQEAVDIMQQAERKEQFIQPLYRQAMNDREQAQRERAKAEQLRKEQERLIEQRAKTIADEQVRQMFGGVPTMRESRLEEFCEEIKFNDGTSVLDAFEEQESQLRARSKSRGFGR